MGLPNSKEFREAFYLKENVLQTHLGQRRKLLKAIASSVKENPNNLEEVMAKARQIQTEINFFQIMLGEIDIGPLTLRSVEDFLTPWPDSRTIVDPVSHGEIDLTKEQIDKLIEQWVSNPTSELGGDDHESSDPI
jgi:hypothetical protein